MNRREPKLRLRVDPRREESSLGRSVLDRHPGAAGPVALELVLGPLFESFPLETRAVTISLFYAFRTLLGGGLMLLAAAVELGLGVAAERRSLEEVAPPLSLVEDSEADALSKHTFGQPPGIPQEYRNLTARVVP